MFVDLLQLRSMKHLRSVLEVEPGSRVVIRIDTDLPEGDTSRLKKSLPTIIHLLHKSCKVIVLGHLGRPEGYDEQLSLKSVYVELITLLEEQMGEIQSVFLSDFSDSHAIDAALDTNELVMMENVRFNAGETTNDPVFSRVLARLGDVFVQDAFAVAHRESASMMLGKLLPCFFGIAFIEEYTALNQALENPLKPVVVILGGTKEDKLSYIEGLLQVADTLLLVGKMPLYAKQQGIGENSKLLFAHLVEDGLDIDEGSVEKFADIVREAGTVVWAGSAGKWEDKNHETGTRKLCEALGEAKAYTIVAGGDTTAALRRFNMESKVGFVASGGGAMLYFLANKTLPVL